LSRQGIKKFYKSVDAVGEGDAFAVCLDGKAIRAPHGAVLAVPKRTLADAIAQEWRDQVERINLDTMPLTRLAYAAADVALSQRARLTEQILAFGRADLLCYRAETPAALAAHQALAWNPLLDWATERFGARLLTGTGISYVEQSPESQVALARAIDRHDDFALTALHGASSLLGSLVLALALAEATLEAPEAFALSRLDETFQAEAWGRDAQAEVRAARLEAELRAIARFLRLVGACP
jgi:chaperone required for assembly of F1-ATPase